MRVPVEDLKVGDVILFMGKEPHMVKEIVPYDPPAFRGEHWHIANCEGTWGITLERGSSIEVHK